ncbi:integrase core domain-containing protein, partial [Corynebacterium propinquum]|uniref:integrase core domain-containing protein n=1 Tax=Corynebacterium propinquum TaxID=43769 RepID=UPI001C9BEDFD
FEPQSKSSMNNYNQFKTTVLQPPIESKQYVSIVYNERLAEHGIAASTGTLGDSYDNALAENVNGSYKNELIHRRTWADVVDVENATFEWVSWWNETRLHQSLGYRTPVEVEIEFWKQNPPQEIIEIKANA